MREQQTTKTTEENKMKITEITGQFSMEELGEKINKQKLIDMIANAPKSGIIHVNAYESKGGHGEVANYFYLKGVDYGKMKERSLVKLKEISADELFSIKVTRGVWEDANGIRHTRKAKDRTFKVVSKIYSIDEDITKEAIKAVEESIINPRQFHADYDKEGNGVYSMEDGSLHIRDCQLIHKTILREGDYPQKATGELVALKNAIKKLLPISKYRQVCLDGRFNHISIGGQIIMQDENENDIYVGFAEHKGLLEPRIYGLTETLESVKVPIRTLENEPVEQTILDKLMDEILG